MDEIHDSKPKHICILIFKLTFFSKNIGSSIRSKSYRQFQSSHQTPFCPSLFRLCSTRNTSRYATSCLEHYSALRVGAGPCRIRKEFLTNILRIFLNHFSTTVYRGVQIYQVSSCAIRTDHRCLHKSQSKNVSRRRYILCL
jgi:hypothetical protein